MNDIESKLWDAWEASRSTDDRNALIEYYLPAVRRIAKSLVFKLPPCGIDFELDDFVNASIPSLITLIESFDRTRKLSFWTFATMRVKGSMVDEMRSIDWLPRLERTKKKRDPDHPIVKIFALSKANKISENCEEDYRNSENDLWGIPFTTDPPCKSDDIAFWQTACRGLKRTERLVLLMQYRLGLTQIQIARSLGVSESRISQISSAIKRRLKSQGIEELSP